MSGSRLIELMRKQAPTSRGIELATVINPPPALGIRVDNMEINLEGDDLIVCEYLMEHTRTYTTIPDVASSTLTQWSDTDPPQHSHTHNVTDLSIEGQTIIIHTNLEAGDRVAVMALPGGQQYLVWDKVVVMGG